MFGGVPNLGCGRKMVHGDCSLHMLTVKLGQIGYFDNWDCKKTVGFGVLTPNRQYQQLLQGFYKYHTELFHDVSSGNDAEKKECYNNHFRSVASYLTRQSERGVVHRYTVQFATLLVK